MDDEHKKHEEAKEGSSDAIVYYIIGAVALVAIVGAGYLLRPKPAPMSPTAEEQPAIAATSPIPTPTLGPITKLGCDRQYYNPVIGFSKYYFSVDGGDLPETTKVNCKFTVTGLGRSTQTEIVAGQLTFAPERNGQNFKCITKAMDFEKNKPTVVKVDLSNDKGATASCSATFLLP